MSMPELARRVWREGFCPGFSTRGLLALRDALVNDDPRLVQGTTTVPAPMQCTQSWPCEAACATAYCGWQSDGLETVGDTEEFFARACFDADQRLGEPAECRRFLNWFDETDRTIMIKELLVEVDQILEERSYADL